MTDKLITDDAQAEQEPAGYQFRQRSGVGKGPQSSAPWCDWCAIDRETYEIYQRVPNGLVQVRPVFAAQPPAAPVETDAEIEALERTVEEASKTCNSYLERALKAEAKLAAHNGCSADSEIAKLREEVEKWHRVAMEAGAITCVGGSHIYPLRDEVKKLRADLLAYEITFKRIAEEDALHAAEPQEVSVREALENLLQRIDDHFGYSGTKWDWKEQADARAALALTRPHHSPGE